MAYKREFNKDTIKRKNFDNIEASQAMIERTSRFCGDPEKDIRLKTFECKRCYYMVGPILVLNSFTHKPCDLCETEMTFSNSNTDAVCSLCANTNKLCAHCGCDIEMNSRRHRDETGRLK